jgi:hypothetical protein
MLGNKQKGGNMKVSELILRLQNTQEKMGDCKVMFYSWFSDGKVLTINDEVDIITQESSRDTGSPKRIVIENWQ